MQGSVTVRRGTITSSRQDLSPCRFGEPYLAQRLLTSWSRRLRSTRGSGRACRWVDEMPTSRRMASSSSRRGSKISRSEDISEKGKQMPTVLITGGHSGLGLESAKHLAAMGLNLALAGRTLERIEPVATQLSSAYGVKVSAIELDVSSLASVRGAVAVCRAMIASGEIDALQAIICNAGANFLGKVSYSVDGYENTFATNYLGHFLLVQMLLDHVAENGRIVFVASGTHDPDTRDGKFAGKAAEPDAFALANQGKDGSKAISSGKRYSTSKLCIILYAYELDRRLKRSGKSIVSIAYDPGSIPETGLMRGLPGPLQSLTKTPLTKWILRMIGISQGSLDFSGASLAKVTADPRFAQMSGKYLQSNGGSLLVAKSSKASYNEGSALKLWDDSKRLASLQPSEEPASLQ